MASLAPTSPVPELPELPEALSWLADLVPGPRRGDAMAQRLLRAARASGAQEEEEAEAVTRGIMAEIARMAAEVVACAYPWLEQHNPARYRKVVRGVAGTLHDVRSWPAPAGAPEGRGLPLERQWRALAFVLARDSDPGPAPDERPAHARTADAGRGGIMALHTGLGKSWVALASHYMHMRRTRDAKPMLLVAKDKNHTDHWVDEIRGMFPGMTWRVVRNREVPHDEDDVGGAVGAMRLRQSLVRLAGGLADVVILPREALRKHAAMAELAEVPWARVVVDEAHAYKNRDAEQSAGLRALTSRRPASAPPPVWLLTATPVDNGSHADFCGLVEFIAPMWLEGGAMQDAIRDVMARMMYQPPNDLRVDITYRVCAVPLSRCLERINEFFYRDAKTSCITLSGNAFYQKAMADPQGLRQVMADMAEADARVALAHARRRDPARALALQRELECRGEGAGALYLKWSQAHRERCSDERGEKDVSRLVSLLGQRYPEEVTGVLSELGPAAVAAAGGVGHVYAALRPYLDRLTDDDVAEEVRACVQRGGAAEAAALAAGDAAGAAMARETLWREVGWEDEIAARMGDLDAGDFRREMSAYMIPLSDGRSLYASPVARALYNLVRPRAQPALPLPGEAAAAAGAGGEGEGERERAAVHVLCGDPAPEPRDDFKFIFFSRFVHECEMAHSLLSDRGVDCVLLTSDTCKSELDIELQLNRFKTDVARGGCRGLICTERIVGQSHNLQMASHVYFSVPHMNPCADAQAIGRVAREGQRSRVFVTYLAPPAVYIRRAVEAQLAKLVRMAGVKPGSGAAGPGGARLEDVAPQYCVALDRFAHLLDELRVPKTAATMAVAAAAAAAAPATGKRARLPRRRAPSPRPDSDSSGTQVAARPRKGSGSGSGSDSGSDSGSGSGSGSGLARRRSQTRRVLIIDSEDEAEEAEAEEARARAEWVRRLTECGLRCNLYTERLRVELDSMQTWAWCQTLAAPAR